MTEFKQTIVRGTRLLWDEDKRFFKILDFRNVTRHFADPDFDGDPVAIVEECPICGKYPCEIAMYNNAEKYLGDVLQDRFDQNKSPPITMWRQELATRTSENDALYREYLALKDETHKVEKIRASVKVIIQEEMPRTETEQTPQKSQGAEL